MIYLELPEDIYWEIQSVLEKSRRNDLIKKLVKARDDAENGEKETYEVQTDSQGFMSLK